MNLLTSIFATNMSLYVCSDDGGKGISSLVLRCILDNSDCLASNCWINEILDDLTILDS